MIKLSKKAIKLILESFQYPTIISQDSLHKEDQLKKSDVVKVEEKKEKMKEKKRKSMLKKDNHLLALLYVNAYIV